MNETESSQVHGWMSTGSAMFEQTLARLPDPRLAGPSLLDGWTRAHVAGHVAGNADALCHLLSWARTGVETPMYSSPSERAAGIEAAAGLPPGELRRECTASAARLDRAIDELPEDAWSATVRTARGRAVAATEVIWMRVREVWVHAVDLDAGVSFDAIPKPVARELLSEALRTLTTGNDDLRLRVAATDLDLDVTVTAPATDEVVAPAAELLPWVLGRPFADTSGWPALPPWL